MAHTYRPNGFSEFFAPGMVIAYAGDKEVPGWLLCFGQAVSRTGETANLFATIGTTHGVGDGSTTFNLPDLRGRTIAGVDDMGGTSANRITVTLDGDTFGAAGGSESQTTSADLTGDSVSLLTGDSGLPPIIILNYLIKL